MNWKDWLFIPKGDKIVILLLLCCILVLFISLQYLRYNKNAELSQLNLDSLMVEDHRVWVDSMMSHSVVDSTSTKTKKLSFVNMPLYTKMEDGELIELNTADTNTLKRLPLIGSVFANRIVKYRTSLGGFASKEQLNEIWGLDTYTYSLIEPYITLTTPYDSIYINAFDFKELLKHPYLNYKQVSVIVDIRSRKGAIKSIKRLELLDEFTQKDINRLRPYLNFRYQ